MTSWVIKASKRCNLRCLYCYEWQNLDNAEKISVEDWKALLTNIRAYHVHRNGYSTKKHFSHIVWHGGEPLLLPHSYINEVLSIQREIFSDILSEFTNSLQSNLFSLKQSHLDIIEKNNIGVGVSYDHKGGVRLTKNGKETESSVLANVNTLRRAGISCGFITVIAGHTWNRMDAIYNFYAQNHATFRALALREGGSAEKEAFTIRFDQAVESLVSLFIAKFNHSIKVPVDPIDGYFQTVIRKILGLSTRPYDRKIEGERVFIVDTDGTLYVNNANYRNPVGNIFREGILDIVNGSSFSEYVRCEEEITNQSCGSCEFQSACDHFAAVQEYSVERPDGCLAKAVMTRIEAFARSQSVDEELLLSLTREVLQTDNSPDVRPATMV